MLPACVTHDDEYVIDIRDGAAGGNMMRSEDCPRSLQLLSISQYDAQLVVPGADYWDFQALHGLHQLSSERFLQVD